MEYSDKEWVEFVDAYVGSLSALHASASGVVNLAAARIEAIGPSELGDADRHLANSRRLEHYLEARIGDRGAQQALARLAGIDFQVAQFLEASADEPDQAVRSFAALSEDFNIDEIESDLRGKGRLGGGQTAQTPLDTVTSTCDRVLDRAGHCGQRLVTGLGQSVTAGQVLDGLAGLLGAGLTQAIGRVEVQLGWVKKKALAFVEAGITKLASVLRIDEAKIRDELKQFWSRVESELTAWAADWLGLAKVEEVWSAWLRTVPPPAPPSIDSALLRVSGFETSAMNQLTWADRAIGGFRWVGSWVAHLAPEGPVVLAAVAAALGGWVVWATRSCLRDISATAAAT